MFRIALPLLVACTTLVSGPPSFAHEVTPITTFSWDLNGAPFSGPGVGVTAFGPETGEPVWKTTLDVTFTTAGSTLASDIEFIVSLPVDDVFQSWVVSGSDLGFPAATGTYTGSIDTTVFEGVVTNPTPLPYVPMDITVVSTQGGLFGTFAVLELTFGIGPRLGADVPSVPLGAGGTQVLSLHAGPTAGPGLGYLLLGSASGTTPGITVGGQAFPLNPDAYMTALLVNPTSLLSPGSVGLLDESGTASVALTVPPGFDPSFVGLELDHAWVAFDLGAGTILSVSNPVSVTATP